MNAALDRLNEELDDFVTTLKREREEAITKLERYRSQFEEQIHYEELEAALKHGTNVVMLKKIIKVVRKLK